MISGHLNTFVRIFRSIISLHCPWRSTLWRGNPTVHSHGNVALNMQWTVYRGMYRQPITIKQCSIQFLGMFSAQAQETGSFIYIYRVSQEECARLRESVPYVKVYRYNPKHIYSKVNSYGDNGQRILKIWQFYTLINYQIHIKTGRNMLFL